MSLPSLIIREGRDIARERDSMDVPCLILFIAFLIQTLNWWLAMKQSQYSEQRANYWWERCLREMMKGGK